MLNMSELAGRTGLTRQAISQYEKGDAAPAPDKLRALAAELGVDERYFVRPLSVFETSQQSPPSFRSLVSSTNKSRLQARSFLEWMTFVAGELAQYVSLPDVKLPDFEIDDFIDLTESDIEELAISTRKELGIGLGPISDLTLLLENHGVIIGSAPLLSNLDGLSAWFSDRPFVLINSRANAVRHRFDLAHELGHLILRNFLDEEELEDKNTFKLVEKQAHFFAGAFLMPERSFVSEVYGIDFDSLIKLKERWKVSIAAIIMRLSGINFISDSHKHKLFQVLSMRNARRHEPLDDVIEKERPRLFSKILELLEAENLLKGSDLREKVGLSIEFLSQMMAIPLTFFAQHETPDNVVVLRR